MRGLYLNINTDWKKTKRTPVRIIGVLLPVIVSVFIVW